MVERLEQMPEGVMGFRATGKLTREDYRDVLIPPIREAVNGDGGIRLLFELGPGFEGYEPGALVEDAKADLQLGVGKRSAWERIAVVTDVGWARRAIEFFGWMTPGESRVFSLGERDRAEEWVAG